MNAVIVISDLEFGGAQRQVVELVNNMDPSVCSLHVCSLSDFVPLAKFLRVPNDRFRLLLRKFRFDFTVVPRLASFLKSVNADVVHTYLFDATVAARLASRIARRPAVIGSERNTDYKIKRRDYLILKATRKFNDLTIANSHAGADFNRRLYSEPMEKFRVVHNGVDINRFAPRNGADVRKELGLTETQPVIGMFASFKPQKNHVVWLRAAKRVIAEFPDAKLLFVGDELHQGGSDSVEFKQKISQAVAETGLGKHCIFVGNKQDVDKYYNASTLTVLPSLFEGTPNVVLESMACGVPVVATNVSDNALIIREGKTGFVVPVNDEQALSDRVITLLRNSSLRGALAEEARQWVAGEFSCGRLAEKTAAVYREAIALRRAGAGVGRKQVVLQA